MSKLYYPTPDELQGATPLNGAVWFERHQNLLVKLANTDWGRDLLLIDKRPYPVVAIGKNFVRFHLGMWDDRDHYLSDFRVGSKWGNIIRYRWLEVKKAIDRMILLSVLESWHPIYDWKGKLLLPVGGGTHTTYYPDPDSEGSPSTVDGDYGVIPAESVFNTMRDSNGTTDNQSASSDACPLISSDSQTNRWDAIRAGCYLFNTANIGADTKDSAIISFVGEGTTVNNFSQSVCISLSNLASPTAVAASDFQNRSGGITGGAHTQQSDTRIAYSAWAVNSRNNFTLNSVGLGNVSTSGVSSFGVECLADMDYTEPSWSSNTTGNANMFFADWSGTSNDPRLIVEHSTSFVSKLIMF